MIAGLDAILQVKLPVTDLERSIRWYCALLELRLWTEFVEDGVLRGAGLIDEQARYNMALRDPTVCASRPDLRVFDVVALRPASHEVLDELVERCARLGFAHGAAYKPPRAVSTWTSRPDGTVLRFYHYTGPTDTFTGIEFRDGEVVQFYDTPRSSR